MFIVASVVMLIFMMAGCGTEDGQETSEKKQISIGLDPYDYATVPAYLSQVILEEEGFDVKVEEADVGILYEALANEEIDAFIDVWRPNLHEAYLEQYDDTFISAGTIFSDMPLGIAVPSYMEDINTIEDLASNGDLFNHEVYAIEPGSGMAFTTEEMVKDYEMDNFEIKNSSTAGMLSQVETAIDSEEAIAFNAWRPHPMFVRFDIKFLEDPRDTWKLDDVEIGVTKGLEEEAPIAFTLFSNMELNLDMVEDWLIAVDEGKTPEELAETWVKEHQDTVDEWLEK